MKQVYTDPRFPDFEIHSEGNNFRVFELWHGRFEEVDSFTTYAEKEKPVDSAKRAKAYFDRMADGQISSEWSERGGLPDQEAEDGLPGSPDDDLPGGDRDHSDMVNNEPKEDGASIKSMIGSNVLTHNDVVDYYNQAVKITDPEQRKKAMDQVKQMAARLESAAHEIVRRLIG